MSNPLTLTVADLGLAMLLQIVGAGTQRNDGCTTCPQLALEARDAVIGRGRYWRGTVAVLAECYGLDSQQMTVDREI